MCDTVSFSQDAFHATILLPALIDFPMENLRKIFKLMLIGGEFEDYIKEVLRVNGFKDETELVDEAKN